MYNVAWLFLFSFGVYGATSLLSGSFYPEETYVYVCVACGLVALVLSLVLLQKVSVLDWLRHKTWQQYYERIPIDVSIVIACVFGIWTISQLNQTNDMFYYFDGLVCLKNLVTCTVFVTLVMMQALSILRRFHHPDEQEAAWKGSVTYKIKTTLYEAFLNRRAGLQVTLLLGVMFASGFGFLVVCMIPPAIVIYVPLFFIVTIPSLIVIYRNVGHLNRIVEHSSWLVLGNRPPDVIVKGHSSLARLAANMNTLKVGVETSHAAQAKSERLKTELITNVSHDLRTPLTSIITYTELLKTRDLADEERDAYIDVIDRKSQRLKTLIEDLFEASKMASGNIELVKERVDLAQLLEQTLAENDEMIQQSSLHFRITKPNALVYCEVDGQKMWRVFDNLLRNILKYSLEHTRVYVSLKTDHGQAVVTFKNVSKYELRDNIDELFERFKRGDTSRHTDGSGLGLAIAKSIVDLHDGSLDLEVDGDLFKAVVTLPCVKVIEALQLH